MVKQRDGFTCQSCGYVDETGRTLVADHANEGGVLHADDPFDTDILWTLCLRCSGRKDGKRAASIF